MIRTKKIRLSANLTATALALALSNPLVADDAAPAAAPAPAPAPAEQAAAAPEAPAKHPAQAAREAMEERRAAHLAELENRYDELRKKAAGYGFKTPPAPPWTEDPKWLTFQEMQERMKASGVELQSPPAEAAPAPAVPTPSMGMGDPEEQKRIFDTIGEMTPEQQKACFALSRWHRPSMMRRVPPAYMPQRMPQFPPGLRPHQNHPNPGMVRPQ